MTATAPDRRRDADRTRREILEVATAEFAQRGFAGARVDDIAERMRTTKRMIYYYYGGKRELYAAVLEAAYAAIRAEEQTIEVEDLEPPAALRRVAELTFDHHEAHPHFIRLVAIENVHRAQHLAEFPDVRSLGSPAIELIERILARGRESGDFTREVDALDVHMVISAFCVFRIANRYTFRTLFDRDLRDPDLLERYRRMVGDLVVGYVTG
ncbi:MAG TPA: TetR/AcrR family transcriptional regulator [Solirubrobacteraceae bacterium]|nr:TetR/AcrR family transcriptional regulator [Solirubrobacteraceae bacterium]